MGGALRRLVAGMALALCGGAAAGSITDVTAAVSDPWDGRVRLSYVVSGVSEAAYAASGYALALRVTAEDGETGAVYEAAALEGAAGLAEGRHEGVVWDLAAQGIELSSTDVVFTVSCAARPMPYCVVDLSGGPQAASYPVSYLEEMPEGGWGEVHKTERLVLRRVEEGEFAMGDVHGVHGEPAAPGIVLTKPFYLGVFETTQRQWELVTDARPSGFTNAACAATRPVEKVKYTDVRGNVEGRNWPASSAVDAASFMGRLRARTGLEAFDLPTEAQWERACRAGTETDFSSGENWALGQAVSPLASLGRYFYNAGEDTAPDLGCDTTRGTAAVGSYAPNAWGFYDMHGNVRELCLDRFAKALEGGAVDPSGPATGSGRVARGGSWKMYEDDCTSFARASASMTARANDLGFRVARTLEPAPEGALPSGRSPSVAVNAAPRPDPPDEPEAPEAAVAPPVISPGDGTVFEAETCTVTLACATEGAAIFFTTNGVTPRWTESRRYRGPFTVAGTVTVVAVATNGWTNSVCARATIVQKALSLREALDVAEGDGVEVATGGDAAWRPVRDATAAVGASCARSGTVGDGEASWLRAAVSGAGRLAFFCRTSCERDYAGTCTWDRLEVWTNGVEVAALRLDGESGWVAREVVFAGVGPHEIVWRYVKDEEAAGGEDGAWVDGVVWTPAAPSDATQTTAVPVPHAWLAHYYPGTADYEACAKARAANGRLTVEEAYVAGVDPTDPADDFRATIIWAADGPRVSWAPDLRAAARPRVYTVLGRERPGDGAWTSPADARHRFFKVRVELAPR